jgi:hypothetical protein
MSEELRRLAALFSAPTATDERKQPQSSPAIATTQIVTPEPSPTVFPVRSTPSCFFGGYSGSAVTRPDRQLENKEDPVTASSTSVTAYPRLVTAYERPGGSAVTAVTAAVTASPLPPLKEKLEHSQSVSGDVTGATAVTAKKEVSPNEIIEKSAPTVRLEPDGRFKLHPMGAPRIPEAAITARTNQLLAAARINPAITISDPEKAALYFRGRAVALLRQDHHDG